MPLPYPSKIAGLVIYILIACLCVPISGCGAGDRTKKFIPSLSIAEKAVRDGMEAWKRGEPAGIVKGTKPVVHVVDSARKSGPSLERFEILGEVPGNAPRCFAVKVTYSGSEKQERLRYIVAGIDPLWVFRQEDYDLLAHWEHPMEEPAVKKTESKPNE